MPVTRTTLLGGPAAILWRGHTLFAQSGIVVTPALELAVVDSDAQGSLDATASYAPVTIQFSPTAPFADLLALYPYLDGALGTSLFGAVDTPLVLIAANGVRLTFAAAAITQMPDLSLTSHGVGAGAVTFLARGARSLPITDANRVVTIDTAEFPTAYSTPPQLADDFEITWGAAPWLKLQALDGVKVKFAMKSRPVLSAANALLDLTLESLAVSASFNPGRRVARPRRMCWRRCRWRLCRGDCCPRARGRSILRASICGCDCPWLRRRRRRSSSMQPNHALANLPLPQHGQRWGRSPLLPHWRG